MRVDTRPSRAIACLYYAFTRDRHISCTVAMH